MELAYETARFSHFRASVQLHFSSPLSQPIMSEKTAEMSEKTDFFK